MAPAIPARSPTRVIRNPAAGDEADQIDEKQRAQGGCGQEVRRRAQVKGDPRKHAYQGKEHIESDGKRRYEPAAAEERLHLIEKR